MREYGIRLKEEKDIEAIKKAGRLSIDTIDLVERHIKPGVKTDDLNTLVHDFTIKNGATPAPLNYRGFPKSVCISINEVICHGIPGEKVLRDGDIVNIDVTPILNGYYADANKTFFVGKSGQAQRHIGHRDRGGAGRIQEPGQDRRTRSSSPDLGHDLSLYRRALREQEDQARSESQRPLEINISRFV